LTSQDAIELNQVSSQSVGVCYPSPWPHSAFFSAISIEM